MAKTRYFNLKEGSEKVNGIVIRVRPNAPLEKRLSEITGAPFLSQLQEYQRGNFTDGSFWEHAAYSLDVAEILSKERIFLAEIDQAGDFDIVKGPRKNSRFYLEEISSKKAGEMKKDAEMWRLQQGYMDGGLS